MDIGDERISPALLENGNGEGLNISDVLEAITLADPFGAGAVVEEMQRSPAPDRPYVRIVEQPAGKMLRFRYECEGRSAGSIPGASSTPERKTFPAIEICGYKGRAAVVVSCVTRDKAANGGYRPHPHNLVGRELCKRGICTVNIGETDSPVVTFSNLGIQCVKRKEIANALRVREEMKVDPFKTGFGHKDQPQSIDLNAVRLCFQVFIPDERHARKMRGLPPVVSDIIYDKKAMSDLIIMRLSSCSGTARGGQQIILLCEKVTREDIAVIFFERENDVTVWEESASVQLVHKQYAIVFTTPPYRNTCPARHVQVYIQLKRPSDDTRSMPVPFEYQADQAELNLERYGRKRPCLAERFQEAAIKSEPRDRTPPLPQLSSPPLRNMFSPSYVDTTDHYQQQWQLPVDMMQPNISMPGTSGLNLFANQNLHTSYTTYTQPSTLQSMPTSVHSNLQSNIQSISPNMQVMSPNMQAMSPNMQSVSPNMQSVSPNMQAMSPNMQAMSPNMQAMSPNMQAMSPNMQAMSPNMQRMSPNMQAMSPNMQAMSPINMQAMSPKMQGMSPMHGGMTTMHGAVSPLHGGMTQNMGNISPNLHQQNMNQMHQHHHPMMDTVDSDPNLGNIIPQLNSTELTGLSGLLGD